MEEIRRIKVGDVVKGYYESEGAYRVTSISPKGTVKGQKLKLVCVWTADASMQNAAYRPTDEVEDPTEVVLGRLRQPTLSFDHEEHIWLAKERQPYFLDNGSTMPTWLD